MEIVLDSETYLLPKTASVELLQEDGSTVTLGPDYVKLKGQTATITKATVSSTLAVAGVPMFARATTYPKPKKPKINPLGALVGILKGLTHTADSIAKGLDDLAKTSKDWLASGAELTADQVGSSLKTVDTLVSDLESVTSKGGGAASTFELDDLTPEGKKVFKSMLNEGPRALDWAKSTRHLLQQYSKLKKPVISSFQSYWSKYITAIVGAGAFAAYAEHKNWAPAVASSSSSAVKTSSDHGSPVASGSRRTSSSSTSTTTPQLSKTRSKSPDKKTTTPSKTTASSSSSTSASATPEATKPYFILMADGISMATFDQFTWDLDRNKGDKQDTPLSQMKAYSTKLNDTQVKEIEKNKEVEFVVPMDVVPEDTYENRLLWPEPLSNPETDGTEDQILSKRKVVPRAGTQDFAWLLSQKPRTPVKNYYEEDDAGNSGEGVTIFILDTGFNVDTPVS